MNERRETQEEKESEGATTFKTLPCVRSKRSRVYVKDARGSTRQEETHNKHTHTATSTATTTTTHTTQHNTQCIEKTDEPDEKREGQVKRERKM